MAAAGFIKNKMKNKNISASFFAAPSRYELLKDAINSLKSCKTVPEQISCYFNPVLKSSDLDKTIDFCENNDIKVFTYQSFNCLSKVWNHSIRESNSPYHLICNDDIIFENAECIDMILQEHRNGHHLVKGAEAFSAFSISKRLVNTVGYFDENFVWSWEDADYRLRMVRSEIKPYEILPNPIKHLRCQSDRNDDYWNKSSEYFFQKWNISKLLVDNGVLKEEINLDSEQRRYLLINKFFGDNFYENYSKIVQLKQEIK